VSEKTPPNDAVRPREPGDGDEFMDVSNIHAAIMREKDEPTDGYEPIPTTWLAAVIALAMAGGWYLGRYNGDFAMSTLEGAPAPTALAANAPAKPIEPMVLGKRVFNNCMACHQASGTGIAGQFPPLDRSEWVLGDESNLVRILLQGLGGPVQVLGKTYNAAMPAWGSKLSDEQIAGVLTYIRGSWGNKAAAVGKEAVAAVREHVGKRNQPWTESELHAQAGKP
jgi:mono/diheme cytochrome c family protein